MVIERVIRFMRVMNGVSGENTVAGPRLAMISLPRVKFIEGDKSAEKYFREDELSPTMISKITNVPIDRVTYYLGKKEKGDESDNFRS